MDGTPTQGGIARRGSGRVHLSSPQRRRYLGVPNRFTPHKFTASSCLIPANVPTFPCAIHARRFALTWAVALCGGALSACAHGSLRRDVTFVDDLLRPRLGQGVPTRSETGVAAEADTVARLLAQPMTAESAIRIVLIAHPALRATYAELGLARADVVQAALLANPVVALQRFATGSFQEFGIAQSFLSLLSQPMRRRVAEAQLARARLRVAENVFRIVTDARTQFVAAVSTAQVQEVRERAQSAAAASATAAAALHAAGNLLELDLVSERATAAEFDAAMVRARGEGRASREQLVRALGVSADGQALVLPQRLPELPAGDLEADSLLALAVSSRLDLAEALQEINAAGRELGLTQQFRLLPDGELTFGGEREDRGPYQSGFGLSIPLPLFDRGQSRMLRAASVLRAAVARQEALVLSVRADVRAAHAVLVSARARFEAYRARVLPLRRRVTEETQLQYNAMAVSVFGLLQARQGELNAAQEYIEAARDYWTARVQLERAVGTILP